MGAGSRTWYKNWRRAMLEDLQSMDDEDRQREKEMGFAGKRLTVGETLERIRQTEKETEMLSAIDLTVCSRGDDDHRWVCTSTFDMQPTHAELHCANCGLRCVLETPEHSMAERRKRPDPEQVFKEEMDAMLNGRPSPAFFGWVLATVTAHRDPIDEISMAHYLDGRDDFPRAKTTGMDLHYRRAGGDD